MIYELFGLPSSGKTTTLTMIAQNALRKKSVLGLGIYDRVFTSFYCEGCLKINFDELKYYDFSNSLIIIDEISLYADNRNFKSFDADLLYFFKLHRHYHIDLIWSSQSYSDADKKIRDVTDTIFLLERSRINGFSVIKKIYHNYSFSNRQINDTYDIAPRVQWKYIYRPKWYKYFNSFEHKELPVYDKKEVWKK